MGFRAIRANIAPRARNFNTVLGDPDMNERAAVHMPLARSFCRPLRPRRPMQRVLFDYGDGEQRGSKKCRGPEKHEPERLGKISAGRSVHELSRVSPVPGA